MQLTINTEEALSETDLAILALLTGDAPAPASKPAAKKAAAAKPEPEASAEEDLLGGTEPTMADAVALATKLVSEGSAAQVKEALAKVGAKRVSELTDDNIATFVNSLSE
jgi:hypothetical protein